MVKHFPSRRTVMTRARRVRRKSRKRCRETILRITREPGYADAVAALLIVAADLFTRGETPRRFLTHVVHISRATLRSLGPDSDLDQGYWD